MRGHGSVESGPVPGAGQIDCRAQQEAHGDGQKGGVLPEEVDGAQGVDPHVGGQPVLQAQEHHGVVQGGVVGVAADPAPVKRQHSVDVVGIDVLQQSLADNFFPPPHVGIVTKFCVTGTDIKRDFYNFWF